MIFKGIDNQIVELRLINYQFPQNTTDEYDSNWLNVYLNVKSNLGNWQTVDPSLLTWEVTSLIEWFTDLSHNKEVDKELEFVEINLSFEFIGVEGQIKKIRIHFYAESRPKSAKPEVEYYVDFDFSNDELDVIAKNLKAELNKYPQRKVVPEVRQNQYKKNPWKSLWGLLG